MWVSILRNDADQKLQNLEKSGSIFFKITLKKNQQKYLGFIEELKAEFAIGEHDVDRPGSERLVHCSQFLCIVQCWVRVDVRHEASDASRSDSAHEVRNRVYLKHSSFA